MASDTPDPEADGGRVVRVVPDVAGIEAEFDYLVPGKFDANVQIGTIVRVQLAGRRVRGWVVADHVTPPPGVRLLEIQKVTGLGPSGDLIDLAGWAAWRWAGKRSFFLQTASPLTSVRRLPPARTHHRSATRSDSAVFREGTVVLRQAPVTDPLGLALEADDLGPSLLITPSHRAASRLARRMREQGRTVATYPDQWALGAAGGTTVIGTRAAAWAPMPEIAAIVVFDAHDEALQSERSPTWSAVEVAVERATRSETACVLASPAPRLETIRDRAMIAPDRNDERSGWAAFSVVDLRHTDPRTGLYSESLVKLLRSEKRVICVLNRKGRSQLLVCSACDEIARCEKCQGSLGIEDDQLTCRRCESVRPVICGHCGAGKFKQLRPGVTRVREDMESLALRPVGEVTGDTDDLPDATVLIGTEAVLHRVGRSDAVVFLDFDQELMAPRYRANEDALVLLARASRLVGRRSGEGIVMIQTRQPDHDVIEAAVRADPGRLTDTELERRQMMGWPPINAVATVSGEMAKSYTEALPENVEVLGPNEETWLVRAPDITRLCDAFSSTPRPTGKLRIEIDPQRI